MASICQGADRQTEQNAGANCMIRRSDGSSLRFARTFRAGPSMSGKDENACAHSGRRFYGFIIQTAFNAGLCSSKSPSRALADFIDENPSQLFDFPTLSKIQNEHPWTDIFWLFSYWRTSSFDLRASRRLSQYRCPAINKSPTTRKPPKNATVLRII